MTVRCPRCRKKHEEPSPKRCGCGESLLAVIANARRLAGLIAGATVPSAAPSDDDSWGSPGWPGRPLTASGAASEPGENDW